MGGEQRSITCPDSPESPLRNDGSSFLIVTAFGMGEDTVGPFQEAAANEVLGEDGGTGASS